MKTDNECIKTNNESNSVLRLIMCVFRLIMRVTVY